MIQAIRQYFEDVLAGPDPRFTDPVPRPRPSPIEALPEAERVEIVRVQPGDVIVLTFPGLISQETAERIKRTCESNLFPNNRVMVIGDGARVSVLQGLPVSSPQMREENRNP